MQEPDQVTCHVVRIRYADADGGWAALAVPLPRDGAPPEDGRLTVEITEVSPSGDLGKWKPADIKKD